jgi:regulator of replication initiation timing
MNSESADRYRAAWLKAEHEVDALREQLAEVKAECDDLRKRVSNDFDQAVIMRAENERLKAELAEVEAEKVRAERGRDHWMQRYESLFQATRLAAGPET